MISISQCPRTSDLHTLSRSLRNSWASPSSNTCWCWYATGPGRMSFCPYTQHLDCMDPTASWTFPFSTSVHIYIYIYIYLSANHHLIMVERFACPSEPESYAVWSVVLLLGFPLANWCWKREQTKNGSTTALWPERGKDKGAHPTEKQPLGRPIPHLKVKLWLQKH